VKAPNFGYLRPKALAEAYNVLADGEAVALAGGQSLLAALNLRLASPQILVDIGDLPELRAATFDRREIRLGALTRHAELLSSDQVSRLLPLLPRAAALIGHPAIRNRGTLGGSLAFADPAAELPACAVALDATIIVGSRDGQRDVRAEDFFTGLMETALQPGELILGVRFEPAGEDMRYAIAELSRRHGDFAVAGIAVAARVERGRIAAARVAYFGCVEKAQLAKRVSAALTDFALESFAPGSFAVGSSDVERLIETVDADLAPDDTPGWRADTKRKLARVVTRRALEQLVRS
jgi:carbon-monoxide dehydrogenase medium subunit